MTSHSPVASVNLSAIRSSIGRTRTSVGFAGSGFFSGGLAIDVRPQRVPRRALDCAPWRRLPRRTRCSGRRMLHPGRIEGRPPALLVVPRELKIVALARHADGDVADAGPGVEPGAERVERAIVRGHAAPGESKGRAEELAALVEHRLTRSRGQRAAGLSAELSG